MTMNAAPTRQQERPMVPKVLAFAMFGLMAITVLLVAFAQITDRPKLGVMVPTPIADSKEIILSGNRAGIYTVLDLQGNQLALSSEEKAGFIGVIGRTFDRERSMQGITSDAPVSVVRRTNGKLAIVDETTGLTVELIGYGADNIAAFERLLD